MLKIGSKKPATQSEKAYSILKKMIKCGDMPKGEVVSILSLSDQLGIGRTPITVACQRLESDGLVRIIPKQGVWINTVSVEEAREIYEARAIIEAFFVQKAMTIFTQDDIDALHASIERQLALGLEEKYYEYMAEDAYFHCYFIQKYNNKILAETYERIVDRIFLYGVKSASNKERVNAAMKEHRDVVSCIENADINGAGKAVERHIVNGYRQLTRVSEQSF